MCIGFTHNIGFNVVHCSSKYFLSFDLRHSVLKNEREGACDEVGNYDTAEKSALEGIGYSLWGLLSEKSLSADNGNKNDRYPDSDGVAEVILDGGKILIDKSGKKIGKCERDCLCEDNIDDRDRYYYDRESFYALTDGQYGEYPETGDVGDEDVNFPFL